VKALALGLTLLLASCRERVTPSPVDAGVVVPADAGAVVSAALFHEARPGPGLLLEVARLTCTGGMASKNAR
jgi:hypothetical protein